MKNRVWYLKVPKQVVLVEEELGKAELAAKLQPASYPKKTRRKYQLSKVGIFLLDERLIPILEENL